MSVVDFKIIAITSPSEVKNEAAYIAEMLSGPIDYVHLRKPGWTTRQVKSLIEDMPYEFRIRLRLHGHFELLNEFNLAGVQLNSRCPVAPRNALSITKSCHTLSEITETENFEYVTLSPVYDSISKQGYMSAINLNEATNIIKGRNVIALGGVVPQKFHELKKAGFCGAALLGYIWNDPALNMQALKNKLKEIMKNKQECYNS